MFLYRHASVHTLSSILSFSNSTTMDCGIHFRFLHTNRKTVYSNGATQNDPAGNEKVQAKYTIVCEFMGLQQTMAELD